MTLSPIPLRYATTKAFRLTAQGHSIIMATATHGAAPAARAKGSQVLGGTGPSRSLRRSGDGPVWTMRQPFM